MASYVFQPVRLQTGAQDSDGRLVFVDDELTAVLVLLADEMHGDDCGKWCLEAEFQHLTRPRMFDSLQEAETWLRRQSAERWVH